LKKQKEKKAGGKKKGQQVDVDAEASAVADRARDAKDAEAMADSKVREKGQDENETPAEQKVVDGVQAETKHEEKEETPPKPTHNRQPSLSLQSKMRSSSFRRTSVGQGPLSPTTNNLRSPTLPPLTPDGDTIPDIYRKQAVRLEELEKENKRLEKQSQDAEARWRKTEAELEEARETNSEAAELRARLEKAGEREEELVRLVGLPLVLLPSHCAAMFDRELTIGTEKRGRISESSKLPTTIANAEAVKTRLLAQYSGRFFFFRPTSTA